jgi:serine/threonine protein kinase
MAKPSTQLEGFGWKHLANLGRGGQGDVVKVEKIAEPGGRQFAAKYLTDRGGEKARERFRREMDAVAKLDHKGIVKVIEYAQTDATFQYYIMEYIEGSVSLKRRMDEGTNLYYGNALKALDGYIQILEALAVCEKHRIVHRDLSPANVLVTQDDRIILIDFGLCHIEDGNAFTMTDEAVGTPHYRAPECSGYAEDQISIRSDLYSAGKILWAMITNKTAFDREKPAFNDRALSRVLTDNQPAWHLHHIFAATIRHDPKIRYENCLKAIDHAKFVRGLITGGYKPLEKVADGTCPVCGLGNWNNISISTSSFYNEDRGYQRYVQTLQSITGAYWICPNCFCVMMLATGALRESLEKRKSLE